MDEWLALMSYGQEVKASNPTIPFQEWQCKQIGNHLN